jgi:hypothetical protein
MMNLNVRTSEVSAIYGVKVKITDGAVMSMNGKCLLSICRASLVDYVQSQKLPTFRLRSNGGCRIT